MGGMGLRCNGSRKGLMARTGFLEKLSFLLDSLFLPSSGLEFRNTLDLRCLREV